MLLLFGSSCIWKMYCEECGVNGFFGNNHPMLHKMDVASVNNSNDLTSQVILRVVPVYIKGTTVVSRFALYDEASNTT
jgi:hypothetical protein